MVMATQPFPQERDVSRTPEPPNSPSNPCTGDGRFAWSNPGGPGRPRGAVRGAASALDQVAVEVSTGLIKIATELAHAGNLEALKKAMARTWPPRRMIRKGDHERRLRALEEASNDLAHARHPNGVGILAARGQTRPVAGGGRNPHELHEVHEEWP
jgi:hypothetical protein